jgi:transposase-like protein
VFLDYPPAIRRAVSTTNAIESFNYSLRKVLKGRSAFPNDESIMKVLYIPRSRGSGTGRRFLTVGPAKHNTNVCVSTQTSQIVLA